MLDVERNGWSCYGYFIQTGIHAFLQLIWTGRLSIHLDETIQGHVAVREVKGDVLGSAPFLFGFAEGLSEAVPFLNPVLVVVYGTLRIGLGLRAPDGSVIESTCENDVAWDCCKRTDGRSSA